MNPRKIVDITKQELLVEPRLALIIQGIYGWNYSTHGIFETKLAYYEFIAIYITKGRDSVSIIKDLQDHIQKTGSHKDLLLLVSRLSMIAGTDPQFISWD